ncbi:hypothetical protein BT96DRAFT_1021779 [Gymnopus androsaceus JB14]|uniref:Sodium/calcium exchanger membrane region domain-containing protein n=1 Tax=Gymnopus androsaceus JB14 TaxID=1447944 RepID=A0A6A4HDC1_9AGAR|nr:hypothetical protein BT96DRAFT_1021779 [Gymnopus androsaceus JB14]
MPGVATNLLDKSEKGSGESRRGTTSHVRAASSDSAEDIRIDFAPRDEEYRSDEDIEEGAVRPSLSARTPSGGSVDWFKDRFMRRGKRKIGTMESLRAIVTSSGLNLLVIFIPVSWAFHFTNHQNPDDPTSVWPFEVTFAVSLLALVPLEKSLEYGGDQISLYCGKEIGDLIIVTLNNAVEATLAIILLVKCELRILQSTIIGVILLHLLLVPGVAFIIGGAKLIYQSLNEHSAQLNHILLLMGVLTLVLPTALYSTLKNSGEVDSEISKKLLDLSHILAIILLVVYAFSRVFLYNPPGENNALRPLPDAPIELIEEERKLLEEEPEVNQWVCIAFLFATIAVMAPTAEWLVDSVDVVKLDTHIEPEFFGLIILPLASFTADALLAVGYFIQTTVRYFLGWKPPPAQVAKARSIDISIQPITLLFDAFEVAVLIGACFLVNFVTADAKTNWAEGATMVSFYIMIAITAWFYVGNTTIAELLQGGKCVESS